MNDQITEVAMLKLPESVNVALVQEEDGAIYTTVDIEGKHTDNGAVALLMMAIAQMTEEYGFNKMETVEQFKMVMSIGIF